MGSVTITYRSTRAVVARWYWHSLAHNPKHQLFWLLCMLALGYMGFVWPRILGFGPAARALGTVVAPLAGATFFALYPQVRFKPQERTLTISPAGVDVSVGALSKFIPWAEVAGVDEWREIVRISSRNLNALLIPFVAFATVEDRREFVARCRMWLAQSV